MAKKNQFSTGFRSKLTRAEWEALCPPMEYRVIGGERAYELGIVHSGMSKVNMVVVGASGSTDGTMMYFANAMRVDEPKLDQEPYFELYEPGKTEPSLHGMFHHAGFTGSRETLSPTDLALIAASGSTADISFTSKPDNAEGKLEELQGQGKITGFEFTWSKGMNAMGTYGSASSGSQSGSTEEKK